VRAVLAIFLLSAVLFTGSATIILLLYQLGVIGQWLG